VEPILFQSLIDIDKWNEARWTATAFLHDQDGTEPPYLGLVFENIEAGRAIFTDLLERLGPVDAFEELYVSIVEGEILGEEPGYSLHITSDPTRTQARLTSLGKELKFDQGVVISKFHRMTPAPDSPHLKKFKAELLTHGRYRLIPLSATIQPQFDYAIEKKEIHFRQASEITKSDLDSVVFPPGYFDNESVN
jgi:hypothetical protein